MNKAARPEKSARLLDVEDLVFEDFGYLEVDDGLTIPAVLSYSSWTNNGTMRAYDCLGHGHLLERQLYGKTWRVWAPETPPMKRDKDEKAWLK